MVCLLLGIGNWIIGAVETAKYQNLLHKTAQTGLEESYRNFQQLDEQKNEEVLRRINEDREKYNAARVKLNFFYVVLTGGEAIVLDRIVDRCGYAGSLDSARCPIEKSQTYGVHNGGSRALRYFEGFDFWYFR